MKMTSFVSIILTGLIANQLFVNDAYAYLDPGTGSALLQGVLAAVAAIAITAKLYWHRLLRFFGIRKTKKEDSKINEDK